MEQNLSKLHDAFKAINDARGNDKLPIIQELCKDEYIKSALILRLNPFCTFGIRDKSITKQVKQFPSFLYTDLLEMCTSLSEKRGISDVDIANVQSFLSRIKDEELARFAVGFITKSATIGITGKTLNKALGEKAVPLFECMLANKYFEHQNALDGKHFHITEKLDGIRCLAFLKRGEPPALFSRQGQQITGLIDIEQELAEISDTNDSDIILDGELLISDRDKYDSKEQYKRTTKIVRRDGEKHGATYNVFDIIPAGAYELPYCDRRAILDATIHDKRYVLPLPVLYRGYDQSEILLKLEEQRSLGHEGIMINISDVAYQPKRTNVLLKCKVMQDCDLKIIDFLEGNGKYKGTLGSIVVDYKGTALGVGSGLSDEDREHLWNHRNEYVGRIATVQYFEETQDANGKPSLRFPVFKEIREEGKEVSYN